MNHHELISALTPLHGAGEARAIVRMVMEERFGLSQTDLLLGKDTDLSANDRTEFEKIARRLLAGEPVQHVLGYAYFYGHRFRVTPDVLIPRPETEELVRWSTDVSSCAAHPAPLRILDLCTGSGCIAISLALAYPDADVCAVDLSEPALAIARENALTLGANNVCFFQGDVLSFDHFMQSQSALPAVFDLITANPPYVRESEATGIHPTVLNHEPSLALFVPDEDPLRFYRAIAQIGLRALTPGGHILAEINTDLPAETSQIFSQFNYTSIEVRNDQFGRPRMIKAERIGPHKNEK